MGNTDIATIRSLGLGMVRVDIIAGTAQAKPDNNGIKERPDSPTFESKLSNKKAARGR